MPVTEEITTKQGLINCWEITESARELEASAAGIVHQAAIDFPLEARYRQHIVTLLLHKKMFGKNQLSYLKTGKPVVADDHISISHSGNVVVMMQSEIPCGIDIELVHPRIKKVVKKFLNDDELKVHAESDVTTLIQMWTAKEAMFKVYGTDTVFMRSNIFVDIVSPQLAKARLVDGALTIKRIIRYRRLGEMVLAWTEADE